MQMIVELELTKQLQKNLNGDRCFPGYIIAHNPTYRSFSKVNVIILKESETGPKRAINVRADA